MQTRRITQRYGYNSCSLVAMNHMGLRLDTTHFHQRYGMDKERFIEAVQKQCPGAKVYCPYFPTYTPRQFAKAHPRGRYIIIAFDHVMACKDGFLIEQNGRGNKWAETVIELP